MFISTLMASLLAVFPMNLEPCFVDGSETAVECTMLSVPKSYQNGSTDTVEVHVIKAASHTRSQRSPVFILVGGPGQAATEMTFLLNRDLKEIRKLHDVVFVAQRGSGLSTSQQCEAPQTTSTELIKAAFGQCREEIKGMEEQLSTHTLAQDIEATRIALGYEKISLWGASYGTYAAQHYATLYPAHVDSMILDAVLALDGNPLVAGGQYPQQSLERLDEICQQDKDCATKFPRWKQHFLALLDSADADPMTIAMHGEPLEMDQITLAHIVRAALYSPSIASKLPLAIENARNGDTRLLGALNEIISGATTHTMYIGLTMGVLCQEHVYSGQGVVAEAASIKSFTKDTYYTYWLDVCSSEKGEQADYINIPDNLAMPTLMISGGMDPITPAQSAQQALAYLSNAQHIVIPNAGHVNSGRGCMPRLINEFLLTGEVADTDCISNNQFPAFLK